MVSIKELRSGYGSKYLWLQYSSVKASEQYSLMVLFVMLYKVVLTLESMDEILECDYSNESYWAVLSCSAVFCALLSGSIV